MNDLKCIKKDRTPSFNGLYMGFNVSFKLTNISKIWTVCWFLRTGIWTNFLISPSILKVKKNGRPHFGNPETVFGVKSFNCDKLLNYIYEIIPFGTKTT